MELSTSSREIVYVTEKQQWGLKCFPIVTPDISGSLFEVTPLSVMSQRDCDHPQVISSQTIV